MGESRRERGAESPSVSVGDQAQIEVLTVIGNAASVRLEIPEPASPQSPPAQLPPDLADFVGRQAELGELRRMMSEGTSRGSALVISAIAGRAGVGKSTLAQAIEGAKWLQLDTFSARGGYSDIPASARRGAYMREPGIRDRRQPDAVTHLPRSGDEDARRTALKTAAALARQSGDRCAEAQARSLDLTLAMDTNIDADYDLLWAELDAVLTEARTGGCHDVAARTLISMGRLRAHHGDRRAATYCGSRLRWKDVSASRAAPVAVIRAWFRFSRSRAV